MKRSIARTALLVALAAAAVAPMSAQAGHDRCHSSRVVAIGQAPGPVFYYDDRSGMDPVPGVVVGPGGTWLYQENNGTAGLQKKVGQQAATDVVLEPVLEQENREICGNTTGTPDLLIF